MKTSINFKAVKSDSEIHNFRKKSFDYIRKDLTPKNEYWMEQKIADRIQKIETYCKEKSGRKLQKNAMPIREAVVVIKENTTMQDLHNLSKRLEEELKIRIFLSTNNLQATKFYYGHCHRQFSSQFQGQSFQDLHMLIHL